MKKNVCMLILASLLCACGDQSEQNYLVSKDSIVVYGNLHLVPENIMKKEDLVQFKQNIFETQQWIYDSLSEDIILLEGYPLDSEITMDYYKKLFQKINGFKLSAGMYDTLEDFSRKYDVQTRFIFEGKKTIFGSEDKELYETIVAGVEKNPELNLSTELIDLRSIAMEQNARYISALLGKKVAIIVGDNHLEWFEKNGYKVYHPPAIR